MSDQSPRIHASDADRRPGARPLARRGRCDRGIRHPGWGRPAAVRPAVDSTRVRHILVRHEQGAGHAAEGYAQATGRVGVCIATSGPGATNLVTPIADAYMDSVPIVAITGQVPRAAIGTDAFQEADISGITLPITKHSFLVQRTEDVPRAIAEAFHLAATGRPGPVLVDVPKDVLQGSAEFSWPPEINLPGYHPVSRPHGKQIREAAKLIAVGPPTGALRRRRGAQVAGGRRTAAAGRAHRHPAGDDADGSRRIPRQPPAAPGHAGHARLGGRGDRAAEGGSADRARHPVRRPGHRAARHVRAARGDHPRRHRPGRDRQEPHGRRADRRRRARGADRADPGDPGRIRGRSPGRPDRLVAAARPVAHAATRSATTSRPTARWRRST